MDGAPFRGGRRYPTVGMSRWSVPSSTAKAVWKIAGIQKGIFGEIAGRIPAIFCYVNLVEPKFLSHPVESRRMRSGRRATRGLRGASGFLREAESRKTSRYLPRNYPETVPVIFSPPPFLSRHGETAQPLKMAPLNSMEIPRSGRSDRRGFWSCCPRAASAHPMNTGAPPCATQPGARCECGRERTCRKHTTGCAGPSPHARPEAPPADYVRGPAAAEPRTHLYEPLLRNRSGTNLRLTDGNP